MLRKVTRLSSILFILSLLWLMDSPLRAQNLVPPVTQIRTAVGDQVYAIQFQKQWLFCLFGTAQASMAQDGNAMKFVITQADNTDWHCQIKYGMSLINGHSYELHYWAKADTARKLVVTAEYNASPNTPVSGYHPIGLQQEVQLTPQWQTFCKSFVVTGAEDGHNIMPEFLFGSQTGTIWVARVSLIPITVEP